MSRACGSRVPGGIYAETRTSPYGKPLEAFFIDPPIPVDIEALGLSPRGAQLIEVNGVWHIFDVVGLQYYPHVADYVEETRSMGASRRLPSTMDFSKLGPESRLVLIHAKAVIENPADYPPAVCPTIQEHEYPDLCAGLWWHDIPAADLKTRVEENAFYRAIPNSVLYRAYPRPDHIIPQYSYGIFMRLPITNLAVIAGRNAQEQALAERNFRAASKSGLDVFMEQE